MIILKIKEPVNSQPDNGLLYFGIRGIGLTGGENTFTVYHNQVDFPLRICEFRSEFK